MIPLSKDELHLLVGYGVWYKASHVGMRLPALAAHPCGGERICNSPSDNPHWDFMKEV